MIEKLLEKNQQWADSQFEEDPQFFSELAKGQNPDILYIGCSDSRVPFTTITDSSPGEIFTHRNIANIIDPTDPNSMSAIEYAVTVLRVENIVVCGHYGCGGIRALLEDHEGLDWTKKHLSSIDWLPEKYANELAELPDLDAKHKFLVEKNVKEQCAIIRGIDFVEKAIRETSSPKVYGLVFDLSSGKLLKMREVEGPILEQNGRSL